MTKDNKSALLYIIGAVILFSTLPIAYSVGQASNTPFLFVTLMYLSSLFSNATYFFISHRKKINRTTLKVIIKKLPQPAIYLATIGQFGYVLYAYSLRYIDEAIGAVLIETSYIFLVILTIQFFKKENRYTKFTTQKWILFVLAFIGVGFVILSQSSTINDALNRLFTFAGFGGIGLVLISAVLSGQMLPLCQLWGVAISKNLNDKDNEIFYTIVAGTCTRIIAIPIFTIIGLFSHEHIQSISTTGIVCAILYGIFGHGIASIFFRIAISKTNNLGINALCYLTPAISLLWLGIASKINVPRIDWLLIGTAIIIISNLLININKRAKQGHVQQ